MILLSMFFACGDGHSHDAEDFTYIIELESNIERGAQLYSENCASCHGENAEGGVGPDLVGTEIGHVVEAIQEGFGYDMPSFPDLTDQDISDIFGYLQSL